MNLVLFVVSAIFCCVHQARGIQEIQLVDTDDDSEWDKNEIVEGEVIAPTFRNCTDEEDGPINTLCNNVCGEDTCRSSPYDPSIIPISKFCQCGKIPSYDLTYHCAWSSKNETFKDDCTTTCSNIYTNEGDEFESFVCNPQGESFQNEDYCVCAIFVLDRTQP